MCKYKRGSVVWILVYYSDKIGFKHRPCIVLNSKNIVQSCRYLVLECSTLKDKHKSLGYKIIKTHDKEFNNLGFEEDTAITNTKTWVDEKFLKPPPNRGFNPIGFCNFVDDLD